MTASRMSALTPWCVAAAVLALGVVWRDCILVASSVLLLTQAFYASMENAKPCDSVRAALRCWLMASTLMVAATGLVAWLISAWLGWWSVHNEQPLSTLVVVAVSALILAQTQQHKSGAAPAIALTALAATTVALMLQEIGVAYAPCLLAALVSAVSVALAARLAGSTVSGLLRCRSY